MRRRVAMLAAAWATLAAAWAMLAAAWAMLAVASASGAAMAEEPAPTKDLPGAKDPAGLKRYDGSLIVGYDHKTFAEIAIPLSALERTERRDPNNNTLYLPKREHAGEGAVTRVVYLAPQDRSPLEVLRNYEEEAKARGGEIVFSCKADACGGDPTRAASGGGESSLIMRFVMERDLKDKPYSPGWCALTNRISDLRYSAIKTPSADGDVWLAVATYQGGDACKALNGRTIVLAHQLAPRAREQKMVTVSAEQMSQSIAQTGRVALYGVYFDTNKAVVKPESDAAIAEIGKLLTGEPQLSVLVVGHTDNVGGFDANLDLSRRRADAVMKAVAARHGVAAQRMRAAGVGMTAPVASNDDEAGRAKNRRVEIVKLN